MKTVNWLVNEETIYVPDGRERCCTGKALGEDKNILLLGKAMGPSLENRRGGIPVSDQFAIILRPERLPSQMTWGDPGKNSVKRW